MSGTKIAEAKDAAAFMVNNLNAGDAFNVIAFDSYNTPWTTGPQPYTTSNMLAALNWIDQVDANGGTNINDAITEGIEDFTTSQPGHARSIVFLTDGQDQSSNEVHPCQRTATGHGDRPRSATLHLRYRGRLQRAIAEPTGRAEQRPFPIPGSGEFR